MTVSPTFQMTALPARIVFGAGRLAELAAEFTALGAKRVLVLSTPHQKADAEKLTERLGPLAVGVFAEAAMHTPVEVTERAMQAFADAGADSVIALGGGSTIGLGKAIA